MLAFAKCLVEHLACRKYSVNVDYIDWTKQSKETLFSVIVKTV